MIKRKNHHSTFGKNVPYEKATYMYGLNSFLSIIYISMNDTQNNIKSTFPAELNLDRGLWYPIYCDY